MEITANVKAFMKRRFYYRRLFLNDNGLPNEEGKPILADLRKFCFAEQTTALRDKSGRVDTDAMLLAEGRRQVYARIQKYLKLSDSDMVALLAGEKNDE
jgi:hypothetical protein